MAIEMTLNRADLGKINEIVEEFGISAFKLIQHNESGIGYSLDIEYTAALKSRQVLIRIPVVGTENW